MGESEDLGGRIDPADEVLLTISSLAESIPDLRVRRAFLERLDEALATGDASKLDELLRWRWQPVDIVTFIEDPYYLGLRGEIFPKVMDVAVEIATGDYDEIVLTGGIGWGKSWLGDILLARSVYEVSCLQSPQRAFGLASGSSIVFVQQSLNARLAKRVLFEQLGRIMRRSPYFQTACPYDRSLKTELVFPNATRITPIAGNEGGAIGENVIGGLLDETNFMAVVEKSKKQPWRDVLDQAVVNYNSIARRRKSRFMAKGRMPGWIILVSSKRYPEDFTERKVAEAKADPSSRIYIADYPQWGTKPASRLLGPTFRVRKPSGSTARAEILETPEYVQACREAVKDKSGKIADDLQRRAISEDIDQEDVLEVPVEYISDFERDIDESLREIAGVSTPGVRPFIVRREMIGKMVRSERRHPFSIIDGLFEDMELLPEFLDSHVRMPRAVHLDLSKGAQDPTGFAMSYVAGLVRKERSEVEAKIADELRGERITSDYDDDGRLVYSERLPLIVVEAALRIRARPNDEIDTEDIIELIVRLRDECGIPIRWVTADHWGSVQALRMLRRRGFITGEQSVDVDDRPYNDLKVAVYDERVEVADNPALMAELGALERDKDGRVDHPPFAIDAMTGKRIRGTKDVADAVAGSVFLLTRRRESWTSEVADGKTGRPHVERPSVRRPR